MTAIVVCTWGTNASAIDAAEEALTAGRGVAKALGIDLDWLVLGALAPGAAETGGRYGVAHIDSVDAPQLASFSADVYVAALAEYAGSASPRAMLFSQTFDARLVVPRLAGRLGVGVAMNALALDVADGGILATASAYGGDTRVVYAFDAATPNLIGMIPGAFEPEPGSGAAPQVRTVAVSLGAVRERIEVVRAAKAEGPRLEDARRVVAGGRGLGSADNYGLIDKLAAAVDGLPAASRAIVDDGWADASRQVGLTGKITKPELYIAVGISGASQHMAGCAASRVIVAINRDADASIFRYARYGIVGDCVQIVPELIKAVEQRP